MLVRCTLQIEIERQPAAVIRCRYDRENRSTCNLRADNSTSLSVYARRCNCGNHSNLLVEVSCVTAEPPHRAHPFQIHGRNCVDGVCWAQFDANDGRVDLSDLRIQRTKINEIRQSLDARQRHKVHPFDDDFYHARGDFREIDKTRFRLCFRIVQQDGSPLPHIDPVVSNEISTNQVSPLRIVRLSHASAPISGGLRIVLFCETLPNYRSVDDIRVVFSRNGWQAEGTIELIHHRVAIVLTTPPGPGTLMRSRVCVGAFVQLHEPHSRRWSEMLPFIFTPTIALWVDNPMNEPPDQNQHNTPSSSNQLHTPANQPTEPLPGPSNWNFQNSGFRNSSKSNEPSITSSMTTSGDGIQTTNSFNTPLPPFSTFQHLRTRQNLPQTMLKESHTDDNHMEYSD